MRWDFQGGKWQVPRKAQNEAWEGFGLPLLPKNGGGKGLGWFITRKCQNERWKAVSVFLGSQKWGGKGTEVVQCAPQQLLVAEVCWEEEFTTWDGTSKLGMEGTEEGSKWSMGRALGCPCFPRMKWKKVKTSHEKRFGRFMIRKSGAGRLWRRFNAHLNNFFLLRCFGKTNLPHEIGLPRWELAGTEEGSKCSMGRGLGSQAWGKGLGWFRKGQIKPWKRGLVASWFPRVEWEGFGGGSMRTSTTTSCCWGVLWIGIYHMRWNFQDGNGRYLGSLKMKHGEGFGLPMLPNNGWKGFRLV